MSMKCLALFLVVSNQKHLVLSSGCEQPETLWVSILCFEPSLDSPLGQ